MTPAHKAEKAEKAENIHIETKVASPAELFESQLTELVTQVLRREIQPSAAVRELHMFWRNILTEEQRATLINQDTPGSIQESCGRLMAAANMLGNEWPSLISYVNATKGF